MKKVFDKIVKKRRYFIVDDKNLVKVLDMVQLHLSGFAGIRMAVGNCGWADEPEKYFIHADMSNEEYSAVLCELSKEFSLDIAFGKNVFYIH